MLLKNCAQNQSLARAQVVRKLIILIHIVIILQWCTSRPACMREYSILQVINACSNDAAWSISTYFRNIAMPVWVMLLLMAFHDLVMVNTSRSVSGTLIEFFSSVRLPYLAADDCDAPGPGPVPFVFAGNTCIDARQPSVWPMAILHQKMKWSDRCSSMCFTISWPWGSVQ